MAFDVTPATVSVKYQSGPEPTAASTLQPGNLVPFNRSTPMPIRKPKTGRRIAGWVLLTLSLGAVVFSQQVPFGAPSMYAALGAGLLFLVLSFSRLRG